MSSKQPAVINFSKCVSYNVVLIGDSRVGKSTFARLMQCQLEEVGNEDPYRGTLYPEIKTLYTYDAKRNQSVIVNILDTPGLNETPVQGAPRPNEELKDIISGHIKKHFASVDLILITVPKKGITDNVIESLFDIYNWFGKRYLAHMCLLLTFCDDFTEEDEANYLESLQENNSVYDFCTAIGNRVLFSGRNDITKPQASEQHIRRRNVFLQHLEKSTKKQLRDNVDLDDIRPIDILESAAATNNYVLYMERANKVDKEAMESLLVALDKLRLGDDDKGIVNGVVQQVKVALGQMTFAVVTEGERTAATKYNEVEVPLKKKAKELREDSYWLKTQRKVLKDAHNRMLLKVVDSAKPEEQTKTNVIVTLENTKPQ